MNSGRTWSSDSNFLTNTEISQSFKMILVITHFGPGSKPTTFPIITIITEYEFWTDKKKLPVTIRLGQ